MIASGNCGGEGDGSNLTWTLDGDGLLTIRGTGAMKDYDTDAPIWDEIPWYEKLSFISSVVIEDNVTSIGRGAFRYCKNLTSITIPNSVTSIGHYAFYYCSSLKSISIPESVTSIRSYTFYYCSSLTDIVIPEGVTSIENNAFTHCSSLTKIDGPKVIQHIGSWAFAYCSSLTEIDFPQKIPYINTATYIGCSSLTSITIPEGVRGIQEGAFSGCRSLTNITIPQSVGYIAREAFLSCKSLTGIVTIPQGVTAIDRRAFADCSNLTDIQVSALNQNFCSVDGILFSRDKKTLYAYPGGKKGNYSIPEGVTRIVDGAFWGCSSLTGSIVIPKGVTTIEHSTFEGCSSLTDIIIHEGVTAIGSSVFRGCSSLTNITIPERVTAIGSSVFWGCSSLTNITIPERVTAIGNSTFRGCSSLTNIILPKGIANVDQELFYGCSSLTSIVIPRGVTAIYRSAFYDCTSLTDITISEAVTTITEEAFYSCERLTDVYYSGTRAQWRNISITAFGNEALKRTSTKIHCIDDPTVSYEAVGGSGSIESVTLTMNEIYTLPACTFTAPNGKEFQAWDVGGVEYAPGTVLDISVDITVKAIWKGSEIAPPAPPIYTLTGTITGHQGVAYKSVTAKLVGLDGTVYPVTVTGGNSLDGSIKKECTYSVSAFSGQYSLEVEAVTTQNVTVYRSAVVKLTGNGQTKNINLPNGQAKSEVKVNKNGAKAVVGGLEDLVIDADGEVEGNTSAEVTMTIDSVDISKQEVVAIQNEAAGQTLDFFEFAIEKKVDGGTTSQITDTGDATVEIVLPFNGSGKKNVKVYRYHEGQVDTLTEQDAGGEKIELSDDSITIRAKKFSVYAVGYTVANDVATPSSGSNSGSGGGSSSNSDIAKKEPAKVVSSMDTPVINTPEKPIVSIRQSKRVTTSKPANQSTEMDSDNTEDDTKQAETVDLESMAEAEDVESSANTADTKDSQMPSEAVQQPEGGISVWGMVGLCVLLVALVGAFGVVYMRRKRA